MRSPSRLLSLLLVALLALAVTGWAAMTLDAAPAGQEADTPTPTETPSVIPTDTPTATITPTPTITPTKPPVRNEITFPEPGDILFSFVRVEGTALIDSYFQYQLHIAPANSEQWSWLTSSYNVVRENALLIFDTRLLADGFYDLRLRVLNGRGNYTESFVRGFEVRNANPPTPTPEVTREVLQGDSPLPTVSPIQTPAPTAVPAEVSFIPGGQGIYKPGNGETLRGVTMIVGTANGRGLGKRFQRYELFLSSAGMEAWQWFYASQQQYFNDILYRWDTTRLANGVYDLRLRIVYQDSNYDEYFVRGLVVANDPALVNSGPTLALHQPGPGALVVGQVDIRGTIRHPRLSRWELYWSPSDSGPDEQRAWLLLYTGDYQVLNDLVARVDVGQVSPGRYDVRVRLVQQDGNYEDAFIRRLLVALPTPAPPPAPHR